MTEENEKKGGALATVAANLPAIDAKAAAAALKESAGEASTGTGEFDYMSFSGKMGRWSMGRDKVEPDPDALYIVEPMMATEGWNCWKGGKPVAKHEWSVYERSTKTVRPADLADHGPYNEKAGEGWQFSLGVGLVDLDTERQLRFSTSSVSGRNVVSDLNSKIADELIEGRDAIAVVELGKESFEAHGQTNFKPSIDVLAFVSRAEIDAFRASGGYDFDDLIDGKIAVDLKKEVAVEEAEKEQEEEAPKKRTRVRASSSQKQEKGDTPAKSGSRRGRSAA